MKMHNMGCGARCARWSGMAVAIVVAALLAHPAQAELTIQAPSVDAAPGTSGTFDVLLVSTGGTAEVAGFSVQLALAGDGGAVFTDADAGTATAYVFGTAQMPPLSFDVFPNTLFVASDASFQDPFYQTIAPGEVYGLVRVHYSIAPDAAYGVRTLQLGDATSLGDASALPISFSAVNGAINVVPEPAGMCVLLCLGGLLLRPVRRSACARK